MEDTAVSVALMLLGVFMTAVSWLLAKVHNLTVTVSTRLGVFEARMEMIQEDIRELKDVPT